MLLTFNFFSFQTIKILGKFTSVILETQGIFKFSVKAKLKHLQIYSIYLAISFFQMLYMQLIAISSLFLYSNAINEKF